MTILFGREWLVPYITCPISTPPALYTIALEQFGVDFPPAELTRRAHESFAHQAEMKPVAKDCEGETPALRRLSRSEFLKKNQIPGDQVLPVYQKRFSDEDIIRREHLVTLPQRPPSLGLQAPRRPPQQPAPICPPLMNNHGEHGQFVLPLETTGQGGKTLK